MYYLGVIILVVIILVVLVLGVLTISIALVPINGIPGVVVKGTPNANKRCCADCKFCVTLINLWCNNNDAIKFRGTAIPGVHSCHFWEPCKMLSELSWWEKFKGYYTPVRNPVNEEEPYFEVFLPVEEEEPYFEVFLPAEPEKKYFDEVGLPIVEPKPNKEAAENTPDTW